MTCTYLLNLIVLLKDTGPTILLALSVHQTPLLLDGAGFHVLNMDCVNFSTNYLAYLFTPASETMHYQKRMPVLD
jgi:hypothetical protein